MEDNYTQPEEQPDESQEEHVEIYSRWAILGFSIFFSPIFGGVLLYRNLKNVGYKTPANGVLIFAICYTLFAALVANTIRISVYLPKLLDVTGGLILVNHFFPKYFPDNDYYPKPIWKPLIISILIFVGLFLIVYYNGGMEKIAAEIAKQSK